MNRSNVLYQKGGFTLWSLKRGFTLWPLPTQHGGWKFSCCVSRDISDQITKGTISALGLPRTVGNLLSTLMLDHQLSSW